LTTLDTLDVVTISVYLIVTLLIGLSFARNISAEVWPLHPTSELHDSRFWGVLLAAQQCTGLSFVETWSGQAGKAPRISLSS
jgi:hypothetical protein